MIAKRMVAASCLMLLIAAATEAAVTQATYHIDPGGTYTYKPSYWVGLPGGVPNEYELNFGIGGTFTYELDTSGPTARLLDLNLFLTGNDAIQSAAPALHPVTADRVEAWLADQTFVNDFIGGLLHLKASTTPGLKLTDGLNGNMGLDGGFDHTPADGTAMLFQFGASRVPEPASAALLALSAAVLLRRQR